MKRLLLVLGLCAGSALAADFKPPVRVKAGGKFVRVESPGYACPALFDLDGDGKKDLIVGQFNKGKMLVCKGDGKGGFAEPTWLQADGKDAEVPGVW